MNKVQCVDCAEGYHGDCQDRTTPTDKKYRTPELNLLEAIFGKAGWENCCCGEAILDKKER